MGFESNRRSVIDSGMGTRRDLMFRISVRWSKFNISPRNYFVVMHYTKDTPTPLLLPKGL